MDDEEAARYLDQRVPIPAAMREHFGGDHVAVPTGTTLGTLGQTVHKLLGQCIGDPLNRALAAWATNQ